MEYRIANTIKYNITNLAACTIIYTTTIDDEDRYVAYTIYRKIVNEKYDVLEQKYLTYSTIPYFKSKIVDYYETCPEIIEHLDKLVKEGYHYIDYTECIVHALLSIIDKNMKMKEASTRSIIDLSNKQLNHKLDHNSKKYNNNLEEISNILNGYL